MAVCSLRYNLSLTGDCTNQGLGAFTVGIQGSRPPYYYQFLAPYDDPIPIALGPGVTALTQTNLTPNTYTFVIFDSCDPPTRLIVNAIISDGVCVSLLGHTNTTCALANGAITARTDNNLQLTQYFLYENSRGYIASGTSSLDDFVFSNLSAGTYYVTVNDGGGCSGKSESCIIKPSTTLDFGFYVVNDSPCSTNTGKIYITGLTGYAPYSYSWSNRSTESFITGLTNGNYSVTVADSTGCVVSKNVRVTTVKAIGFGEVITVTPSCFGSEGQITVVVTGGTAPFYYQGSNGQSEITFNETFTLTGLSSGNYSVTVTDATLCAASVTQRLTSPNGFAVGIVGVVNSTCNNSSGALSPITLIGGTPPFNYTLTYPSGNSIQQSSRGFSNQFQGLSAGTYTLTIENQACSFTNTYTINNTNKFTVTTSTTGTTCQGTNGRISIRVSSGSTFPLTYQITGQRPINNTSQTAVTFNNLVAGNYQVTVTDAQGCSQIQNVTVDSTDSIDFSLVGTNLTGQNNGTAQIYITEGPAPYTIQWSNNVNGQTGTNLTNLSAGTYGVQITDANGCQMSREITLQGYNGRGGYEIYNYCQSDFVSNGETVLKKPQNMFLEGFYDLTSGETNCVLNEAIFYAQVEVNEVGLEQAFFTSNSLGQYPTDDEWFDVIESMIESFPEIGNVTVSPIENLITIESSCTDQGLSLTQSNVSVALKINYDISCVCRFEPIPGPPIALCDMIYLLPPAQVYHYVYSSDTSTSLSVDGYTTNSPSVAFTTNKLWTYETSVGSTLFREWNITTDPFTAVFNRTLNINFTMGDSIGVLDNVNILTTNKTLSPERIVKINITTSTPSYTNYTYLDPNRQAVGTMAINNFGQTLMLQSDTTNIFVPIGYMVIFDSTNYNKIFEIDLSSGILGTPSGIFTDSGTVYIVDTNGGVYSMLSEPPYTITNVSSINGGVSVRSLYQDNRCFDQKIELPGISCGGSAAVMLATGANDGMYDTFVNIGTGTGNIEVTFNTVFDETPVRYQLIWNGVVVADSQFLGNNISIDDVMIDKVTGTTTLNRYVYYPSNGDATTVIMTTDWYLLSEETNLSYTMSNITGFEARGNGGSPGQIGVVNNYPFIVSPANTPDIKLGFNKTLPEPSYFTVRMIGLTNNETGENFACQFSITQCPPGI